MYKESLQGLLQFNVMPDELFFPNPFLRIEITLLLFQLFKFFFGQQSLHGYLVFLTVWVFAYVDNVTAQFRFFFCKEVGVLLIGSVLTLQ